MINYQVGTGPEMESVKMQSWLERAAGVIRGCDRTSRVSWKEKCNDFSSENYNVSFGRMSCIIPPAWSFARTREFMCPNAMLPRWSR